MRHLVPKIGSKKMKSSRISFYIPLSPPFFFVFYQPCYNHSTPCIVRLTEMAAAARWVSKETDPAAV